MWEYLVIELNNVTNEELEIQLDKCGYESWELVNIINFDKNFKCIFKRKVKLES